MTASNDPHLLVFMLFVSLPRPCTRLRMCDQRNMAEGLCPLVGLGDRVIKHAVVPVLGPLSLSLPLFDEQLWGMLAAMSLLRQPTERPRWVRNGGLPAATWPSLDVDAPAPVGPYDGTAALPTSVLRPHGRPRATRLSRSQVPVPLIQHEVTSVCGLKLLSFGVIWYPRVDK